MLTRLRVEMLKQDLAVPFELSHSHVSRIITTWVNVMYHRLKKVDIWSTCEQALTNLPEKVREFFPTLRSIIDQTEIYIEQTSATAGIFNRIKTTTPSKVSLESMAMV